MHACMHSMEGSAMLLLLLLLLPCSTERLKELRPMLDPSASLPFINTTLSTLRKVCWYC